jgi:arylsulfatase A-like enzyme
MGIYPTLCELCGVAAGSHVQGETNRPLLADPKAAWSKPAITTFGQGNHAVRTEGWRYIRYANGDEELYDEASDPYEWTNLAGRAQFAAQKRELAKWLPVENAPPAAGRARRARPAS